MTPSDLPKGRRVLVLIDFINPLDFPGSQDLAGPALDAARQARQLANAARRSGMPVIYANDNFGAWRSDFPSMVHTLDRGSGPAAQLVALMRPRKSDVSILKPMHSAFFGSPLDIVLDRMGARSLILAGLAADICVQLTASDALLRGFKTYVPSDCCASESEAKKATALAYMRDILKCDTRPWRRLFAASDKLSA